MPDHSSPELAPVPDAPDQAADWPAPHADRSGLPLPVPAGPGDRRGRGLVVLAAGCLVAALALGVLAVARYRSEHSPQTLVRRYFAALAGGDAAAALGLAAEPPRGPYLTDVVLRQQLRVARPYGLRIDGTALHGDTGTVRVRYRLAFADGARTVADTVPVVRHGSSWRLARVATAVTVAVPVAGADRLTFVGGPLPRAAVVVFPGALPLGTDSAAVGVGADPVARLAGDRQSVAVEPVVTAAAERTLHRALDRALARCLAGPSEPSCPVGGDTRPVPGSLRGTVLPGSWPATVELRDGGRVTLTGRVVVRGHWQDWNFDNQPVAASGDTTVELRALASVADPGTVVWTGP